MGQKSKEVFNRNTSLFEVFVESIPCSLILTSMLEKVLSDCRDENANSLCQIVMGDNSTLFLDTLTWFQTRKKLIFVRKRFFRIEKCPQIHVFPNNIKLT